jgi:hypothetical protein
MKKNQEPGSSHPEGVHEKVATVFRAGGVGSIMDDDDTNESLPLRKRVSGGKNVSSV